MLLRLFSSFVHVPSGEHEVVALREVDINHPAALNRLLDGELQRHLHDGVDERIIRVLDSVTLGHVGEGSDVFSLERGCGELSCVYVTNKTNLQSTDSSKYQIVLVLSSGLIVISDYPTFSICCLDVPAREKVSRIVLGRIDALRDVHEDGVCGSDSTIFSSRGPNMNRQ